MKGHPEAGATVLEDYLKRQSALILDGGLATELERRGADLQNPLWSAKMLVDDPGLVRDVHLAFLEAGADVIITASYQASLEGFEREGVDRTTAARIIRRSAALAREARDEFCADSAPWSRLRPLVAASIGPYGACLADGSEYRGDYALEKQQLIDFHRPRMEILADCGADLFALETIPSLLEAEALLELLSEFPGKHAWLSFSCRDEDSVSHGERFADCARSADSHPQIVAVGINCTRPEFVTPLLNSTVGVTAPLIAYPNSGERWDSERRAWTGEGSGLSNAKAWFEAGARLIGGCCRVAPDEISALRRSLFSNGR